MINGPMIDSETGKKHIKDQCLDFDGIAAPGVRNLDSKNLLTCSLIGSQFADSAI